MLLGKKINKIFVFVTVITMLLIVGVTRQVKWYNQLKFIFLSEPIILFCLFLIGICNIILFSHRKNKMSVYSFSFICFLFGIRIMLIGQMNIIPISINYNYYIIQMIDLICLILLTSNKLILNGNKLLIIVFSILMFLPCFKDNIYINIIYYSYLLAIIIYLIIKSIYNYNGKDNKIKVVIIGLIFIFNSVLYRALYNFEITKYNMIIYIIYILCILIYISISLEHLSESYNKMQLLSKELAEHKKDLERLNLKLVNLNKDLEKKIYVRTVELENSNSNLRIMNEKLKNGEEARNKLIANISHDLRSPITSIRGYIEAIQDGIVKKESDKIKYLSRIHIRILDLERQIQDLFELTQLESKKISIKKNKILLKNFIKEIYNKFELDAKHREIKFSCISLIKNEEIWLDIDTQKITQVVANIIFNAFRYVSKGGEIKLECERINDEYVIIKVSDTGIGISKEHLSYIFNRFYKVSYNRSSENGNSGLGLSIAKEIISNHGGDIWGESTVGQGSVFFFTLPIYKEG